MLFEDPAWPWWLLVELADRGALWAADLCVALGKDLGGEADHRTTEFLLVLLGPHEDCVRGPGVCLGRV